MQPSVNHSSTQLKAPVPVLMFQQALLAAIKQCQRNACPFIDAAFVFDRFDCSAGTKDCSELLNMLCILHSMDTGEFFLF